MIAEERERAPKTRSSASRTPRNRGETRGHGLGAARRHEDADSADSRQPKPRREFPRELSRRGDSVTANVSPESRAVTGRVREPPEGRAPPAAREKHERLARGERPEDDEESVAARRQKPREPARDGAEVGDAVQRREVGESSVEGRCPRRRGPRFPGPRAKPVRPRRGLRARRRAPSRSCEPSSAARRRSRGRGARAARGRARPRPCRRRARGATRLPERRRAARAARRAAAPRRSSSRRTARRSPRRVASNARTAGDSSGAGLPVTRARSRSGRWKAPRRLGAKPGLGALQLGPARVEERVGLGRSASRGGKGRDLVVQEVAHALVEGALVGAAEHHREVVAVAPVRAGAELRPSRARGRACPAAGRRPTRRRRRGAPRGRGRASRGCPRTSRPGSRAGGTRTRGCRAGARRPVASRTCVDARALVHRVEDLLRARLDPHPDLFGARVPERGDGRGRHEIDARLHREGDADVPPSRAPRRRTRSSAARGRRCRRRTRRGPGCTGLGELAHLVGHVLRAPLRVARAVERLRAPVAAERTAARRHDVPREAPVRPSPRGAVRARRPRDPTPGRGARRGSRRRRAAASAAGRVGRRFPARSRARDPESRRAPPRGSRAHASASSGNVASASPSTTASAPAAR